MFLLFWTVWAATVWAVDEENLSYSVVFTGLEDDQTLLSLLQSVSVAVKRRDHPPSDLFLLRRRAKDDGETFIQALHSRGWFDATVDAAVSGDGEERVITFAVASGQRYRLGPSRLQLPPQPSVFVAPAMESLGLKEGEPAESAVIFAASEKLLLAAREQGFPRARLVDRPFELDRDGHWLHVVLELDPGPLVRLGQVHFSGDAGVDRSFLEKHLSWRPGAIYHPKRLDRIHRSLMGTKLFSSVSVDLDQPAKEGELWPVSVRLLQGKHKSIALGGGYSTDKGINLKGVWENRNVFNRGQRIKARTELGTQAQTIFLSHETPDFFQAEQKLTLSTQLDRSLEDAFDSQSVQIGANVSRPVFSPGGEAGLGLEWRLADVMEKSGGLRSSFTTTAIPMTLKLDRSDDLLDPGQGWRWNAELKPVLALSSSGQPHTRIGNRGSHYFTPWASPRIVLALRAEVDTVVGANHEDLAADERLYAGGGGRGPRFAGLRGKVGGWWVFWMVPGLMNRPFLRCPRGCCLEPGWGGVI
ncbi:MAG: hypothetical protein HW380_3083 [Magnetococcales bacterium]|nr:hypothetical protein [Magnetococcales bacterium]